MKVLYIAHTVGMGGASVALLNEIPILMKKGVIPYILLPKEGAFSEQLKKRDIKYGILNNPLEIYPKHATFYDKIKYPYKLSKLLYYKNKAFNKLCKYIEFFKPDIIHTNVGPIHIGFEAAQKYHIPHIWHIREYQIEDFGMYPYPSKKNFLSKIHSSNNYCISITKEIFSHFHLNPQKDSVIYDGVINKNDKLSICKSKKNYILFAGRLEDAKGIKDLIKAYINYLKHKGNYKLYIAGKGTTNYINECKALIPQEYTDKISFLGERRDIYHLMREASIFVVPSRREGFGFITAEAMFNGTIVIGRNTGGTKEQFDNGLHTAGQEIGYRYENLTELTDLLIKCEKKSPESTLMVEKAQAAVCELYDINNQADKIFTLYKKILNLTN